MRKTKELIETLKQHPDRELIFMYPEEGSDHFYTMGYPTKVMVDEYWIDDERVWLRYEDKGEMSDQYGEILADDLYQDFPLTDEQEKIVDKKLEEFIKGRDWKKCVCVYIHY